MPARHQPDWENSASIVRFFEDSGKFKYRNWQLNLLQLAFKVLRLNKVVSPQLSPCDGLPIVPTAACQEQTAAALVATLQRLLVHVLFSPSSNPSDKELCYRHNPRAGLSPAHHKARGRSSYLDLYTGTDEEGRKLKVSVHRLVCLSTMTTEQLLLWNDPSSKFMALHSPQCGSRRNCCSPYHLRPGTALENWADKRTVENRQKRARKAAAAAAASAKRQRTP